MRWPDERWVKMYTRDTPDWSSVSLGARGLFYELMRKVDGAGLLHVGRKGVAAIAACVRGTTAEVAPLLEELVADGCVVLVGERLMIRNFLDAQEAKSSDVARKRTQRERDRDQALAGGMPAGVSGMALESLKAVSRDVTHAVTPGHAASREVTPGHEERRGEERRGEEKQESSADADPPLPVPASISEGTPDPTPPSPSEPTGVDPARVGELQELWNETAHPSLPRWVETGKKRRAWARARLQERPELGEWRRVIERINASDFCRGENDRGWAASPDWLLKSETATKVLEGKYDNRATAPPKRAGGARFVNAQEVDHSNVKPGVVHDF